MRVAIFGWASDLWSMYRVHDVTEGVETRSGGPFLTVVLHTAADRNKLYICLRFSRKMAVLALFCVRPSGADAQLGSQATVRETRPTHISPPHIQILCNAQVA